MLTIVGNVPHRLDGGFPSRRRHAGGNTRASETFEADMSDPNPPEVGRALQVGDPAPDFDLQSQTGERVKLSNLQGRWAVVYFYPQDDTPGCTTEACSFRDSFEDFTDAGATVIGISKDSVESHKKFAEKHRLPFTLLSDEGAKVAKAWGVGKSLGILPGRVTYVISPEGVVRKKFSSQLRASKHKDEAIEAIRAGA
jgi:peroxiredoxin Q/BCP